MADFKTAHDLTAKVEGGYSNNKNDRGGETWKGISRKNNPNWEGWKIIDNAKGYTSFPKNLDAIPRLQILVLAFYKSNYWDLLKLDLVVNVKVANKLYDISVNMGVSVAAKFLQKSLNVLNQRGRYYPDLSVDGKVGLKTIAALNKHPKQELVFKAINVLQGERYIDIAENNESQEDFINGWIDNRIAANLSNNSDNSNIA